MCLGCEGESHIPWWWVGQLTPSPGGPEGDHMALKGRLTGQPLMTADRSPLMTADRSTLNDDPTRLIQPTTPGNGKANQSEFV